MKDEKLDFDRDVYLQQFVGTDLYTFMSSVANTQMFEQVKKIIKKKKEIISFFVY
jgi:hypothetical protein